MSLGGSILKGSLWAVGGSILARLSGILAVLFIARVLGKETYGIVGAALLVIETTRQFTAVGLKQAIVQRQGSVEEYLPTVFTFECLRGLAVCFFVYVSAPHCAKYFGEPKLVDLLRVCAVIPLLSGLVSPRFVLLQKRMNFKRHTLVELSRLVGTVILAVAFVAFFENVWGLVFAILIGECSYLLSSYLAAPCFPEFGWDKTKFFDLFSFGGWLFVGSILFALAMQVDKVFVGGVFNASVLGAYVLAEKISNLPLREIGKALSKVLFPAYASIQSNPDLLEITLLNNCRAVAFLLFPMVVGIFLVAEDFVSLFLGEDWHVAAGIIRFLSIAAATQIISSQLGTFVFSAGDTRSVALFYLINSATVVSGVFFVHQVGGGVESIASVRIIANFVVFVLLTNYICRKMGIRLSKIVCALCEPVVSSFLIIVPCMVVWFAVSNPGLMRMILTVLTGIVFYLGFVAILSLRFKGSLSERLSQLIKLRASAGS